MELTIDKFNGPLDLLLHLIKTADIDIYDINIEQITNQYFDYIKKMEELDLNIASEYLIMAAELIEIKSSTLLPKTEIEEEESPREQLIKKLIDYQNYKDLTESLKKLECERRDYFTKEPSDLKEYELKNSGKLPEDITISNLLFALENFLERKEFSKPLNTKIATKEYSVAERAHEISLIVKRNKRVDFKDLFDYFSKDYIIVTFLAILDLAKNKHITIEQEKTFSNIYLCEVSL